MVPPPGFGALRNLYTLRIGSVGTAYMYMYIHSLVTILSTPC